MGSERPGGCAIYAEALGEVEGECPRCGHAWCCAPISAHKLPLGMPADVSLPSTFLGSETPARAEAPVGVCEAKAAPSSCQGSAFLTLAGRSCQTAALSVLSLSVKPVASVPDGVPSLRPVKL